MSINLEEETLSIDFSVGNRRYENFQKSEVELILEDINAMLAEPHTEEDVAFVFIDGDTHLMPPSGVRALKAILEEGLRSIIEFESDPDAFVAAHPDVATEGGEHVGLEFTVSMPNLMGELQDLLKEANAVDETVDFTAEAEAVTPPVADLMAVLEESLKKAKIGRITTVVEA